MTDTTDQAATSEGRITKPADKQFSGGRAEADRSQISQFVSYLSLIAVFQVAMAEGGGGAKDPKASGYVLPHEKQLARMNARNARSMLPSTDVGNSAPSSAPPLSPLQI